MSVLNFLALIVIAFAINTEFTANGAALPSSSTFDDVSPSMENILKESHKGITWTLVRQMLHTVPVTEADGTSEMDLSSETLIGEHSSQFNLSEANGFSGDQLSDSEIVQPPDIEVSQDLDQIPDDVFDMIPKDRIFSDETHIHLSIDSNSLANQINISNLHNHANRWDTSIGDIKPEDEHSIPLSTEFPEFREFQNEPLKAIESEFTNSDFQTETLLQSSDSETTESDSIEHLNSTKVETDLELKMAVFDSTSDSKDHTDSVGRSNSLQQTDSLEESNDFTKLATESNPQSDIVDIASNSTVKTESLKITDDSEVLTDSAKDASEPKLITSADKVGSESEMLTDSVDVVIQTEIRGNSDEDINDSEVENDSEIMSTDSADYTKDSELRTNFLNNSNDFEIRTEVVEDMNNSEVTTESVKEAPKSEVLTDSVQMSDQNYPAISVDEVANLKSDTPSDMPISDVSVENITTDATTFSESLNQFQDNALLNVSAGSEHVILNNMVNANSVKNATLLPISELDKSVGSSMNFTLSSLSTSTQNSNVDHESISSVNISGPFENGSTSKLEEIAVVNDIIFTSDVNVTGSKDLITEIQNGTEISLKSDCPAPGFCILWFIAQDACSVDVDCPKLSICCKVGCSNACVEV